MIIDFHCHIGKDKDGESFSLEELKASMDRFDIDFSVVFPFNCDDQAMLQQSLELLESSRNKAWIIPFLRFNPNTITENELTNLLDKGFKGVKLHPSAQCFVADNPEYDWIYEMIASRDLPLLFHSNAIDLVYSHPERLITVARRFPNLNIVIAHFFGNALDMIPKVAKYPNIYVDISINSRTLRINHSIYKHGFDRLIFGSDAPYDSQGVALMKIHESGLESKDEEQILSGNAQKLLRL